VQTSAAAVSSAPTGREWPIAPTTDAPSVPATAPLPQGRFGRHGRVAVIAAAALLIAATWIGVRDATEAHRSEFSARIHADVASRAVAVEEQVRRELLVVDQTLRILELEWQRDPQHFDLETWRRQVVALTDLSLQVFVADASGKVIASTRPQIIGTDISGRDYFRHAANLPADDERVFIGSMTRGQVTGIWQMNLERRLDMPDGGFAGVIAVSYDMSTLTRLYGESQLGEHGMIAVIGLRDAVLRGMAGPSPGESDINIAGSPMFAAMQASPDGGWTGPSTMDGISRIHAFRSVPDRSLDVVVGVDRAEAMAPAASWERDALIFAGVVTGFILLLATLLLWEVRAVRLRQDALIRERSILEATLAGMTDGIMMVDADLRLLEWNQRFPEFIGVPADMLRVGLSMEEILRTQAKVGEFGAVDVDTEVARRMALLRTGGSVGTIERPRPGGRMLEIRRNPLPGGGFVTLYTDVTARHETEERLRQTEMIAAIGRLTAGVAHDFNNLLASISGNAEMLHDQLAEDANMARRLSIILQAASRGATMIRQLLAFSRKQALTPVAIDLNQTIRGIIDLLRATLGRSVGIETNLVDGLWPALVDPVQVEHVILNLAINARDAMPDGGAVVVSTANVSLGPEERSPDLAAGDYAVIAVSDTGTGMTPEVLRNAFEPFFTTKPPGEGSGLGLSQVYGVATQSGGGVQIESAPNEGTTVRVFFPRAANSTSTASLGRNSLAAPAERHRAEASRHAAILLVDDEGDCRETIGAMLEVSGYTVTSAEGGRQALRLLDEGLHVDLLLVDVAMPEMSGPDLVRIVRARHPALPIVFVTGGEGERISGERWVLAKPFLTRQLVEMLQAALAGAKNNNTSKVS
jgi:signal transduction histidine kinase/CheY-like chemotaxis protein